MGRYDVGTHEMVQIHGPEQRVVVLDGMIQILTGCVDPRQVFGVHEAQDMVHNLQRELGEENHGACGGLAQHKRAVQVRRKGSSHSGLQGGVDL
jgi:hypothetical protein